MHKDLLPDPGCSSWVLWPFKTASSKVKKFKTKLFRTDLDKGLRISWMEVLWVGLFLYGADAMRLFWTTGKCSQDLGGLKTSSQWAASSGLPGGGLDEVVGCQEQLYQAFLIPAAQFASFDFSFLSWISYLMMQPEHWERPLSVDSPWVGSSEKVRVLSDPLSSTSLLP